MQMCEVCSPEERTSSWLTSQNAAKMGREGLNVDPWLTPTPWKSGPEMEGKPCFQREHNAAGSSQLTDDQERKIPPLVASLDCERE